MILAHISDTHLLCDHRLLAGRFDTEANFQRLLNRLAALDPAPDLILFSGDLGEDATEAEYRLLGAGLRALGIPVRAVPGNHDARAPMSAVLPEMVQTIAGGYLCSRERFGDLAVIGLDTLVPGAAHGALCAARLGFLADALEDFADQDLLIFMHHPPIATGITDLDGMGLIEGGAEFARLVAAHGRVRAILCGHQHRRIDGICGGAPVRVAPSASHQFACDLRPGQPWRFSDEPAGFLLHLWGEGALVTHMLFVDP